MKYHCPIRIKKNKCLEVGCAHRNELQLICYIVRLSQIDQLQKQREDLQQSAETESTMKRRISEFRKTLEQNEVLNTFDRYVFESIVEKVIVGGYDENGNKDPSMLTFIYKTGFENSVDGTNFKPPRKNSKAAKQCADLCSDTTDEVNSMCSYHSNDACGDGGPSVKG